MSKERTIKFCLEVPASRFLELLSYLNRFCEDDYMLRITVNNSKVSSDGTISG
mgnify:CR=1 FL=1